MLLVERALAEQYGSFPPVVLAECLSMPRDAEVDQGNLRADSAPSDFGRQLVAIGHLRVRI